MGMAQSQPQAPFQFPLATSRRIAALQFNSDKAGYAIKRNITHLSYCESIENSKDKQQR
jgi:hypothetical protein